MKLRKNIVERVLRGGSLYRDTRPLSVIYRSGDWPEDGGRKRGFRVVIRRKS